MDSFRIILWTIFFDSSAFAEDINARNEDLNVIEEFTDKICLTVQQSGNSSEIGFSASLEAELSNLLKKLAALGIKGDGQYSKKEYEGILQQDSGKVLASSI